MTAMDDLRVERQHSRYAIALENVEALAHDGLEQTSAKEKDEILREIEAVATGAFE